MTTITITYDMFTDIMDMINKYAELLFFENKFDISNRASYVVLKGDKKCFDSARKVDNYFLKYIVDNGNDDEKKLITDMIEKELIKLNKTKKYNFHFRFRHICMPDDESKRINLNSILRELHRLYL